MAEIVLKNLTKDYRSNEAYKTLRTNIEFSGSDKKMEELKQVFQPL